MGDHGCEYMTGGIAVILGSTGKNFGAGMSGGLAYVYDPNQTFQSLCNPDVAADLGPVDQAQDVLQLQSLIQRHLKHTDSPRARYILSNWKEELGNFVKVFHLINPASFRSSRYNKWLSQPCASGVPT